MATTSFDPAQVFALLGMRHVSHADFDAMVAHAPGDDLRCVFLWGQDCYNCNLFKQAAVRHQDALRALDLRWFQADVYADEALGRRFGLHGVPTFVLYRSGKRLGRITGWPGLPQFIEAVQRQQAATSGATRPLENPAADPS